MIAAFCNKLLLKLEQGEETNDNRLNPTGAVVRYNKSDATYPSIGVTLSSPSPLTKADTFLCQDSSLDHPDHGQIDPDNVKLIKI